MIASKPTVSVLMPTRNEERSVVGALKSVLDQSVQDIEVLVVDGCSTDRTRQLVRKLIEDDSRVRLLESPRRTIPSGLNVGLEAARGRFVARVDGHSTIGPRYLALALGLLDAEPTVAAVGGLRVGVAETSTGRAIAAALSSPFGVGDSINHYATEIRDTDHASFGVYRTAALREVQGWDEGLLVNEDVDIDHRILGAGHRIAFHPQMRIHWHVRETVPALGRQYRRYGRGKAAMVRKNGASSVRPRHLAAPALVTVLAGATALAATGHRRAAATLALPYVAGVSLATTTVRRPTAERGPVGATALAGSFVAMHMCWGLGFLEGYLLRLPPAAASARPPRLAGRRSQQGWRLRRPRALPDAVAGAASDPAEPSAHVEARPWGRFELLTHNQPVTVKLITVLPGRRLSLQRHARRDEWWQVLDGNLTVEVDGVRSTPFSGERVWIPRGATHRLGNAGVAEGRILEIALGDFDEADIERLQDDYQRA